jgi:diguanylate cyclase (GGDEF)-like protein/PAS domain S-box-containing protein
MEWEYTPWVLPVLISAAVSGMLAAALFLRRGAPGVRPFAFVFLAIAWWSLFYAVEISSAAAQMKVIWEAVEIIGIAAIPAVWFIFALDYTGHTQWTRPGYLAAIVFIPAVTVILFWTNSFHHLMWASAVLRTDTVLPYLVKDYGIWFWIFTASSYALLLAGSYLLVQTIGHTTPWYSRQVAPLVVGIVLPWAGNAMYVLQISPIPYLDLAPIVYCFSAVFLTWGVFRFWMFDLVPIAWAAVVDGMTDGVLVLNEQDRVVDVNAAAAQILGIKAAEVIGKRSNNALASFPKLAESYLNPQDTHLEVSINDLEEVHYFDVHISPLYDRLRNLTGRSIVLHEITERKRAEQELEKSHAMLLATFEATADGIMVIDGRGKLARYNRKFAELWKIPDEVLRTQNEQDIVAFILNQLVNPAAFYRMMNRLSLHPDTESFDELDLKDARVFERYSRPQKIGDKRVGRVWSFHDITQQRQAEERLRFMSAHDILTGLYNRVYYEEELNRLEGSRLYPISIIIGDVDGLKEANDHYGHQAGDALLRKSAEMLRLACRTEDVVARIGGDEFGIILPHANALVAEAAIRRILETRETIPVADTELVVSLSLGAATCSSGESLRLIMRQADKVMYQAKRAKRQKRAQDGQEDSSKPAPGVFLDEDRAG